MKTSGSTEPALKQPILSILLGKSTTNAYYLHIRSEKKVILGSYSLTSLRINKGLKRKTKIKVKGQLMLPEPGKTTKYQTQTYMLLF